MAGVGQNRKELISNVSFRSAPKTVIRSTAIELVSWIQSGPFATRVSAFGGNGGTKAHGPG